MTDYVYMHKEKGNEITPKGCGGRAFKLAIKPLPNSILRSADTTHLDGSPMEKHSRIICETCGGDISRPNSSFVIEDI